MPEFIKMGVILMIVATIATTILAATEEITRAPIADAKRQELLLVLKQVLPKGFNNEPDQDTLKLSDQSLDRKNKPVTFYLAKKDGEPQAAAFVVVAPDGYSGNIEILMAVKIDGTINGVRVVSHTETPGLGDKVSVTDWPKSFEGKTQTNTKWGVKKDGGDFDQFAGATITPRAVVGAVKRGLDFFVANKNQIFSSADTK
ncbi:MAG: electron transport complex subunit RsxG [Magnetococcus sp. DMHC-6]